MGNLGSASFALLVISVLVGAPRALLALGCVPVAGGGIECELPVIEDSIVAAAHRENNHGGEPHQWVKVGNGINRAFERIDLRGIAGRSPDIVSATLRHYIYKVGDGETSTFAIHGANPNWPQPFVEGQDMFQGWGYCSTPEWKTPATEYSGLPGVTYNCPLDPHPNDGNSSDCPYRWEAGFPYGGGATGFQLTPLPGLTQRPPSPPACGVSLDCVFEDHQDPRDCWDTFEFNVTNYIRDEVAAGRSTTDVMIRRQPETGPGGVWWFSTEGAVCVLGGSAGTAQLQALRPVLVVRLSGGALPTVPSPLVDPCD